LIVDRLKPKLAEGLGFESKKLHGRMTSSLKPFNDLPFPISTAVPLIESFP